ncbi:ATP-binding protein [Streptomyces sp. NPDC091377]|uniref:ATP-binding protein n=1 Tax=unclassified Streptomyces TaxID=2593676 RepID=UPI0038185563
MDERIAVEPRDRGTPVPAEDAHRVGILRRTAAARLRHAGLGELIDSVGLVVSEMVTNALRHSGTCEIRLVLDVQDGFLTVVVIDGMPGKATPITPAAVTSESGRGLLIVQSVAEDHGGTWGVSESGAQTWCQLAVPIQQAAQ